MALPILLKPSFPNLLVLVFLLLSLNWSPQAHCASPDPPADSLQWQTELTFALEQAQQQNRQVLLVFSGSDWCRPCMLLEREVWETEEFQQFASEHFILLHADFPRKKKHQLPPDQQAHNASLAETYNPLGKFPLVVVLDAQGEVLRQTGYRSGGWGAYLSWWQADSEDE